MMVLAPTAMVIATTTPTGGAGTAQAEGKDDPKGSAISLPNPLGEGNDDPRKIVGNIIRAMLGIVGSLALAVFIYGGFNWVTAAGNEDKISQGKSMIIWASFGLLVIFFSYALVTFILGAIVGTATGS